MTQTRADTLSGRVHFLARTVYSTLRRPKLNRDTLNVVQEYSDGWSEYYTYLERAGSLEQWLTIAGVQDQPSWRNIDGRLEYGVFDATAFYRAAILSALREHFPNARSIIEFGCGVGRNVMYLKRELPQAQLFGYELCTPGVEVAQTAAAKFGTEVQYAQLDYVNDPPSKYKFGQSDVAFTLFSLEQLPRQNARALRNILAHVELGSIHIEPVPENYPYSVRGMLGRIDHWKVDYLAGFDRAVRALNLKGVHVQRLASAHNPLMFPSRYVLLKR